MGFQKQKKKKKKEKCINALVFETTCIAQIVVQPLLWILTR
jgi:hypothetical protein